MVLDRAESEARDAGARDVVTAVVEGDPATRIIDEARDEGANLLVLGSRGLGQLGGLLMGSVSHKVAQLAPCSCLTVK